MGLPSSGLLPEILHLWDCCWGSFHLPRVFFSGRLALEVELVLIGVWVSQAASQSFTRGSSIGVESHVAVNAFGVGLKNLLSNLS